MNLLAEENVISITSTPPFYVDPPEELEQAHWLEWSFVTFIFFFALVSILANYRPLRQGECYWHRKFLKSLEKQGTVSGAAREAGMTIDHCHKHRETNPDFRKRWDAAAIKWVMTKTDYCK